MSIDEFDRLRRALTSVIGEADFSGRADPAATDAQIDAAERALGLRLPNAYIDLVRAYGGGQLWTGLIYSMDPSSPYNIVRANHDTIRAPWIREFVLVISDNGCGDYYCLRVDGGVCSPEVYVADHECGELLGPRFPGIFEFTVNEVLRAITWPEMRKREHAWRSSHRLPSAIEGTYDVDFVIQQWPTDVAIAVDEDEMFEMLHLARLRRLRPLVITPPGRSVDSEFLDHLVRLGGRVIEVG